VERNNAAARFRIFTRDGLQFVRNDVRMTKMMDSNDRMKIRRRPGGHAVTCEAAASAGLEIGQATLLSSAHRFIYSCVVPNASLYNYRSKGNIIASGSDSSTRRVSYRTDAIHIRQRHFHPVKPSVLIHCTNHRTTNHCAHRLYAKIVLHSSTVWRFTHSCTISSSSHHHFGSS
jgi:hypothetical protein